jgi:hypothetical protein
MGEPIQLNVQLNNDQKEAYFRLLALHNDNRRAYDTIKWETYKLTHALFGGFILASLYILSAFKDQLANINIRITIAVFLFAAAVSAVANLWNIMRESELLFLEEGTMFNIAQFLQVKLQLKPDLMQQKWLQRIEMPSTNSHFVQIMNRWNPPSPDPMVPDTSLARWARYHSWYQIWIPPSVVLWVFSIVALVVAAFILFSGAGWTTPGNQISLKDMNQAFEEQKVELRVLSKQLADIVNRLEAIEKTKVNMQIPQSIED